MEPPIQVEYLRSGYAITLTLDCVCNGKNKKGEGKRKKEGKKGRGRMIMMRETHQGSELLCYAVTYSWSHCCSS